MNAWIRALVAVSLIATAGACSPGEGGGVSSAAQANEPPQRPERPTPGVRVVRAEAGALTRTDGFVGEVVALTRVDLAPLEAGQLQSLLVDEGDRVEAEALVGRLDDGVQRRDLGVTLARTETSRAAVREAELQRELAARDMERVERLVSQGARPEADGLAARDALAIAEQRVDAAQRDVALQQSSAALARERAARREVRAPFDGLVALRHVSVGAQVSPAQPIVTLVDASSLRVRAMFPEEALASVQPGVPATVVFDGAPETRVAVELERVASIVDSDSRTIRADFRVSDAQPTLALREGMFARGELELERSAEAIRVPMAALRETDGSPAIWVVEDNVASPVDVEVVLRGETEVAVHGIDDGALVVVSPLGRMEPGATVIVVEEP